MLNILAVCVCVCVDVIFFINYLIRFCLQVSCTRWLSLITASQVVYKSVLVICISCLK